MCGITGILYKDPSKTVDPVFLSQMNNTLNPRGPDDAGLFAKKNLGLAMRRLAIMDVTHGRQPFTNEDQTILVVANGEIYNFQELRQRLLTKGHLLHTHNDCEVIAHLYEEKGLDFLDDLNGMFAIALWDARSQKLILARDRMGKKPLYYFLNNEMLLFGSELKAILAYPGLVRAIDPIALEKYLAYEYIPAPRTIFKNIWKLPAGNFAVWQKGRLETKRYWNIPFTSNGSPPRTMDEAEEELRSRLRKAVKLRLMSDVPLGAFLSGGIDSSSVVAMMAELLPSTHIKTFNIGFKEASFDESRFARQIANHFGLDHHEDFLSADKMLEILPQVFQFLDEPLADPSILPTYLLSKFTRSYVTVALGGDGGDELLAGYQTFLAARYANLYEKLPLFLRKRFLEPMVQNLPVGTRYFSLDFKLKQFMKGISFPNPLRHFVWMGAFHPQELQNLLGHPQNPSQLYEEVLQYNLQARGASRGNRDLYLYKKLYLQDDILTKVDRASMACSLEVRAPFLDKEVVEWLSPLPFAWKLKGCTTKNILKRAMKGRLPKNILHRKKQGFAIPVAKWLQNELKEKAFEMLHPDKIKREGLFNPAYVQQLFEEHQSRKANHDKKLWALLMFEGWLHHWGK